MADITINNLEDDIRDKLREIAKRNGRSMEEEAREILRRVVLPEKDSNSDVGLGTRLAEIFADCQLEEELPRLPRQEPRAADFSE